MNTFFTADNHFFHKNIIKYCKRPFKNIEEMNSVMIEKWNSIVDLKDEVYIVGDFALDKDISKVERLLRKLHGKKYLVIGSHDKQSKRAQGFVGKSPLYNIRVNNYKISLCHWPMLSWDASHYGTYHLYGHHHGNLPEDNDRLSFDVGVDCWDFYPISLEQVIEKMSQKTPKYLIKKGQ